MAERDRHRLRLRSHARTDGFPGLRKLFDGLKEHEKNICSSLSRAQSELARVREDLRREEQYSARVKQQRDKAEKDAEELRGANDQAAQEVARLQKSVSELEDALADMKRVKNRDC